MKRLPEAPRSQLPLENIMTLTRWYPIREVASLQDRVHAILQDAARSESNAKEAKTSRFVPAVDVYEDEHKIVLKLEVPGISQDQLDIRLESNTLTVKGERKFEQEEKQENFSRIERRYGAFTRSFTLPASVDTENVQAHYEAGVLKLELNKRSEAKPKQIKIGVSASQPQATENAAV